MAGKKFTTKRKRVRSKAEVRARKLKVNPKTFGLKTSVEQENYALISELEKEVQAVEAKK